MLTLPAINEVGFFVCAFGAYFGARNLRLNGLAVGHALSTILCGALVLAFAWLGFGLWPD